MKYSLCIAALVACATEVVAYPSKMFDMVADVEEKRDIASPAESYKNEKRQSNPGFNAGAQYVSTSGQYAYVAPTSTDLRGPCPGLNAMANHGYIPHNGVATIPQFITGTYNAFGMAADLAGFLAIYGAVFDGDLTSWSIGGPPSAGLLSELGVLGTPTGLIGSHNKYESDASPVRGDLYEYGNDYKNVISQFEALYALPLGPNGYDLTALTPFRATRFQQSIDNNPYFFNGPFSGVIVQPAAYTFIYRFMGNKSAEYPEGYLNGEVLKTFYGIVGEPGNFSYVPERFPENWYKRAIGDEYSIAYFASDAVAAAVEYPQFANIGGNTGKVNTFAGVDLSNLTGGVFDLSTLLEGNNLVCFGMQATTNLAPDILKGLFTSITAPLGKLSSAVSSALSPFTCPTLTTIDSSELAKYPGSNVTTNTGLLESLL